MRRFTGNNTGQPSNMSRYCNKYDWREKVRNYRTDGVCGKCDVSSVSFEKVTHYKKEEDCIFLTGERKTTRYENREVEYYDMNWQRQYLKFAG